MRKNMMLKIILSSIFTIFLMFFVNINNAFAASHYYTDFADLGYKTLINATFNYCPSCGNNLGNHTFADNDDRQFHCQTACIHRSAASEDLTTENKLLGIIDINKNGSGFNHATFTDINGYEHDLGNDDNWAKLAFVSYRAEAKGQLENNTKTYKEEGVSINTRYSYSFVYAFGYIWENGGLRGKCQEIATEVGYVLPMNTSTADKSGINAAPDQYLFNNSSKPLFDAEQYVLDNGILRGYNPSNGKYDGKDEGQTIRARIFIFDGDRLQAIAIMSADAYNVESGVSVEKEITAKSHYQHRGNTLGFKITVTNESTNDVNFNLTDTYKTTEYELISIDGVAPSEEDKDGSFVRNLTIKGMSGNTPTKKEIMVRMKILLDAPAIKDHTEADIKLKNTVTISDFKNPTTGETIENSSKKTSDWDYYVALIYKVSINRYITRVDNYYYRANDVYTRMTDKSEKVYAETGQRVILCIRLKNEGITQTENDERIYNYGYLFDIEVADLWSNSSYVDTPKYWDSATGTWNDTLPEGHAWSHLSDGSGFKLSSLAVGSSSYLYISYRVVQKSIIPEEVMASAKITKIRAGTYSTAPTIYDSNVDVIADDGSTKYMAYISPESSDKFTIKAYKVNITKTADKSIVDIGENITFTITVTNSASGEAYGNFHEIILEEIYDSNDFDFVSDTKSSLWTRNGTTYTYKTDPNDSTQTGLAPR